MVLKTHLSVPFTVGCRYIPLAMDHLPHYPMSLPINSPWSIRHLMLLHIHCGTHWRPLHFCPAWGSFSQSLLSLFYCLLHKATVNIKVVTSSTFLLSSGLWGTLLSFPSDLPLQASSGILLLHCLVLCLDQLHHLLIVLHLTSHLDPSKQDPWVYLKYLLSIFLPYGAQGSLPCT